MVIYCFGCAATLSVLWTVRRDVDHWCPSPLNYTARAIQNLSVEADAHTRMLFIRTSMVNESWMLLGTFPYGSVQFGISSCDWFMLKTDGMLKDVVITSMDAIVDHDETLDVFTDHRISTLEEHNWTENGYDSTVTIGGVHGEATPERLQLLQSHRSKLQIKDGKWILCE